MARESEELEREADQTRAQLSLALEDLRARITPGQVVDSIVDYARQSTGAEFLRNVGQEVREHPLPLVLIGIGIAWLLIASSRSARSILANTGDSAAKRAQEFGAATARVTDQTSAWGQQTTVQVVDRVSEVASRVANRPRGATETAAHKLASTTATTPSPSSTRATDESERAGNSAKERRLIAESVALSNDAMQPETPWEPVGATEELDREHR
jgi:Protein of unknown function (DUF3618)